MKKEITGIAVLFGLAAVAFAASSSTTNTTTAGLVEDGIVDSFDKGVETKGIIFTNAVPESYYFNLGAGVWATDNLWTAAYYSGYWNMGKTYVDNVKKTSVMTDGTKVDYVLNETNGTYSANDSLTYNSLSAAFYLKNLGKGGEIVWENNFSDSSEVPLFTEGSELSTDSDGKKYGTSEDPSAGTSSEWKITNNKNGASSNSVTFYFTDWNLPETGDLKLYTGLNYVKAYVYHFENSGKYSSTTTLNGSVTGAGNQITASGKSASTDITLSAGGLLGLTLPDFGFMSTEVKIYDTVSGGFSPKKNVSSYKTVNDSAASAYEKNTEYKVVYGKEFNISNSLTPQITFNFDLGEKIILKARASAYTSVSYNYNGASYSVVDSNVTNYNKDNGKTSSSYSHTESIISSGQNSNSIGGSIYPYFNIGSVYKIVPEKVHLNFGVSLATPSAFVSLSTYKNSGLVTRSYSGSTSEDGNSTNSDVDYAVQGNGVKETRRLSFDTINYSYNYFYIGSEVFLTENVVLDMSFAANASHIGVGTILDSTSISVMLKVLF